MNIYNFIFERNKSKQKFFIYSRTFHYHFRNIQLIEDGIFPQFATNNKANLALFYYFLGQIQFLVIHKIRFYFKPIFKKLFRNFHFDLEPFMNHIERRL